MTVLTNENKWIINENYDLTSLQYARQFWFHILFFIFSSALLHFFFFMLSIYEIFLLLYKIWKSSCFFSFKKKYFIIKIWLEIVLSLFYSPCVKEVKWKSKTHFIEFLCYCAIIRCLEVPMLLLCLQFYTKHSVKLNDFWNNILQTNVWLKLHCYINFLYFKYKLSQKNILSFSKQTKGNYKVISLLLFFINNKNKYSSNIISFKFYIICNKCTQ
jgi:hypothetical protein